MSERAQLKRWIQGHAHLVLLLLPANCSFLALAIALPGPNLRIILLSLWLLSSLVIAGLILRVLLRLRRAEAQEARRLMQEQQIDAGDHA